MPPSGDINCKKSSQYHFVNEYLYKPLNLAEAENKPNVTLRYSERYFPTDIHPDEREAGDYQITPSAPIRRPTPPVRFYLHATTLKCKVKGDKNVRYVSIGVCESPTYVE